MSHRLPYLRAALADPSPSSRRRLRHLLEEDHGIAVVGGCESGEALLELVRRSLR